MVWLVVLVLFLVITVVILTSYIHKLKRELRSHQETWIKIEEITDHNKDGDIIIHCRHQEETKTDGI